MVAQNRTRLKMWFTERLPVVGVLRRYSDEKIILSLDGVIVETTPEHPFWVDGIGWRVAGELVSGDNVKLIGDATACVEVVGIEKGRIRVYNLEIGGGVHTYFVSERKVLVHNACMPRISPIAPDWATKGAHILIGGVELKVLPGNGGGVVFKAVFSSAKDVDAAIRAAQIALQDVSFRQQLLRTVERAIPYVVEQGAAGKSAELRFLAEALRRMGW